MRISTATACIRLYRSICTDTSCSRAKQSKLTIGAGPNCEVHVRSKASPEHAIIEARSGRVFCTALAGDDDDLFTDTFCWLNGTQLRKGVAYLLEPGSQIAIGAPDQVYTVDFKDQGGSDAMMEVLMKSMASQASEEVKRVLNDS
ncbi:hypothetical protein WJX72_008289 [[Myrmecia] bisecta]|uniref:FHA domain-containing protein n=1 Tax=[Myrmecia] bisecta TaxID=41462 RepID=A0AAW1Q361_9CHLO